AVLLFAACHPSSSSSRPWERVNLWEAKAEAEVMPEEGKWAKAVTRTISFLGAAEVRDMSKMPASQLAAFPTRTAGQIRALEQRAGTRVRWTLTPGAEAYLSFIPLGTTNGCPCTYTV